MSLEMLSAGSNPPFEMNVVIEISAGTRFVKYEMDKDVGLLTVDRFLQTDIPYPANYGFIPRTLSEDGDPCDVLVVLTPPLLPGVLIRCRAIGALLMEDEHGPDEKIIAVPITSLQAGMVEITSLDDLSEELRAQIDSFFRHYKEKEAGKWTKIRGWASAEEAGALVMRSVERFPRSGAGA